MTIVAIRGLMFGLVLYTFAVGIGCTFKTVAEKRQGGNLIESRVGDVPVGDGGLYKIGFINEREGWLAQGGHVWRTTDGGAIWSLVFVANQTTDLTSPTSLYGTSGFEFVSSQIGILQVGEKVYKTEDSGDTWMALSDLPLQHPNAFLTCFKFLSDGRHGWIGGGVYRPISVEQARVLPKEEIADRDRTYAINGIIYGTEDGGTTWRRQQLPETFGAIESLYFYDGRHGLAFGLSQVFYTDDSGRRWREADFSKNCVDDKKWRDTADERYPVSAFVNPNLGLLAFKDGYMARSTDGGRSWCDFHQPGEVKFENPYDLLWSINFVDFEHGFGLVGYRIYQTDDGGKSWRRYPLEARIDAISFTDPHHGWAVGPEGLFRMGR
jgi:photosystem II stability/assembly factor-like uncharacterized protein